jgi:hypothetical protein
MKCEFSMCKYGSIMTSAHPCKPKRGTFAMNCQHPITETIKSMDVEEIREEKNKRINELLEEKDVTIQDDYFEDIFNVGETHTEIFRVMSARGFKTHPELIDETLDEIIKQLENYNPE